MDRKLIPYPFPFAVLLITDGVLGKLGFTDYWDGSGSFGDRRLDLGGKKEDERLTSKGEYQRYLLYELDETVVYSSGDEDGEPVYSAQHFTNKGFQVIYFLHEMYEDIISRRTPEEVECFLELTKKKGVNMYPYIESYLNWRDNEK